MALSVKHPGWSWIPALVAVLTLALLTYLSTRAEGYFFYRQQIDYYATRPANEQQYAPVEPVMPPAVTTLIRMGSRLAGTAAAWLAWGGALYLAAIFLGHNGTRFGALVGLTLWSWVPYILRGWIQSGYLLITREPIFNPGLSGFIIDKTPPPMAMSFVPYIPPTRSQLIGAALLSRLDVYLIWQLIWLTVGLAALTQRPRKKSALVILSIWIVLTLIGLIPSAFESAFARFRF
jgi:hypothetical protein